MRGRINAAPVVLLAFVCGACESDLSTDLEVPAVGFEKVQLDGEWSYSVEVEGRPEPFSGYVRFQWREDMLLALDSASSEVVFAWDVTAHGPDRECSEAESRALETSAGVPECPSWYQRPRAVVDFRVEFISSSFGGWSLFEAHTYPSPLEQANATEIRIDATALHAELGESDARLVFQRREVP